MNDDQTITLNRSGESPDASTQVVVPRSLKNVQLIREIGRGGMGVVYLARDQLLHRDVAVKFVLNASSVPGDSGYVQFLDGARAAAAVRHASLALIHQAGMVQEVPYLVMEFIDGPSVGAVLEQTGAMDLGTATAILDSVAQAVGALHERGIVHRDIKPANILLEIDGRVVVTDFGLACLRTTLEPVGAAGTLAYMAPEAFDGNVSPRSDVYALGITAFQLLTGGLPFRGSTAQLRARHEHDELPSDILNEHRVGPGLQEVLRRATHKNPMYRYKTADYFRRALNDSCGAETVAAGIRELPVLVARYHDRPDPRPDRPSGASGSSSYFERMARLAESKAQQRSDTGTPPENRPATPLTGPPAPIDAETSSMTASVDEPSSSIVAAGPLSAQFPAKGMLQVDLPCVHCEYILRSRGGEEVCPECGAPVLESLAPNRLVFADPKWIRRLIWGLWLIVGTVVGSITVVPLVSALLFRAGQSETNFSRTIVITIGMQFATFAFLTAGIFLATAREPGQGLPVWHTNSRLIVRGAWSLGVVAWVLYVVYALAMSSNTLNLSSPEQLILSNMLSGAILFFSLTVAGFASHLSGLVARIKSGRFGTTTKVVHCLITAPPILVSIDLWQNVSGSIVYDEKGRQVISFGWRLLGLVTYGILAPICGLLVFGMAIAALRAIRRTLAAHVQYETVFSSSSAPIEAPILPAIPIASTLPPVHPTPSLPPSAETVHVDVPCIHCGYSLRSRHVDSLCPECGTPVLRSLSPDRLIFADPAWLAKMAKRHMIWLVSNITAICLPLFLFLLLSWFGRLAPVVSEPQEAFFILIAFGFTLIAPPETGRLTSGGSAKSRILAIVLALIAALVWAADWIYLREWIVNSSKAMRLAYDVGTRVEPVLAAGSIFALLSYWRTLARRMPNPALIRSTKAVQVLGLGLVGILILLPLFEGGIHGAALSIAARLSISIMGLASLVAAISTLFLVWVFSIEFKKIIAAHVCYHDLPVPSKRNEPDATTEASGSRG